MSNERLINEVNSKKPKEIPKQKPVLTAPIVSVSANSTAINGGSSVSLTASAMDDQGDTLSYSWVQTGSDTVTILGADNEVATFIAPNVNATLTFELTVSDGVYATTASVSVDVTAVAEEKKDSGGSLGASVLLLLAGLLGLRRRAKANV